MRRLILCALICTALAMAGLAAAFTWEGELDPNEFDRWKPALIMPALPGTTWRIIKNPNPEHPIDAVAQLVSWTGNLIGYRYFKNGEPFAYFFNSETECYERFRYTAEQRKACMECHPRQAHNGKNI